MDAWDFRQQALMGGAYAPILGNFPSPTRPQSAVDLGPDTSSTWSSSYPTTTAAPATSAATSYRYSPRTSTGRRNRYAEIMSQYEQSQPYSFTSMPPSYTGGYDATAYTPAAAPVNRYADIMAQPAMGGGGGRGEREAPSAWSQMTPAERAAYYAQNPTEKKIALGMQDLFGNVSLMGQAAKYFGNDGWYDSRLEKQGYDPKLFAYGPPDLREGTTSDGLGNPAASGGFVQAPGESGRGGGGGRGGEGGSSNSNPGDPGRGGGGAHLAKGGYVSMMHLGGPDPEGPDDGYAALKNGEFVINDKAVKKYGIELMNAINSGKISKGKLRGLLEM